MSRKLVFAAVVVLASAGSADVPAAEFRAGAALKEITPPTGYRMSGYFYERLNTGTHDPLHAKALVLEQGDTKSALVFCDLIGIARNVTDEARRKASEQTKIPAENILIAATHSHTGPLYGGALRDYFHAQAVSRQGNDPAEKVDYPAFLVKQIVAAIVEGHNNLAPAGIYPARTEVRDISFNRRFHMKDGSVRFNPGRRNPDIVRVAGPIDPEFSVIEFRRPSNEALAVLGVFALHLDTVGGTEYSADFPHYVAKAFPGALFLFGAGTCGDINHIDVTKAAQPSGQAMAEYLGKRLTEAAKGAMEGAAKEATPALAVKSSTVACPVQKYSPEQLAKAKANMSKIGGRELPFLEQVETTKIVSLESLPKDNLPLEVQVFRLSEHVAVVGLPGEVFVELGMAIKTASPFEHTIVIELCNDSPAYVPTKKAFAEGSYETVNSRIAPGGGEMLVEEAVKLLKALK